VTVVEQDGVPAIQMNDVFAHLPLALLERIADTRRTSA
jgi:hypothetical protein